ncbi:MAG TPA: protein kinase, partial [Thermoguttaceae bacterium]|nr:protein kinase [Thermoguttaceae bacterium]
MPVSVEQFVENLVRSGLFTPAELAAFQQDLPPDRRPRKPQDLARELVQAGWLTKYQAAEIYQGKTKGLVLGDYVVLDEIGAGGMGQVFKAWHRTMERTVALKKLPQKTMRSPQAIERFHREVKAAARLEHPNIVTAYDAGEAEGIHFLVMQYVDGRDLADVLAERGPLPVAEALDYMIQSARGLEYAHDQGVVHRDIKPANLLLDQRGTVKILDMGLARMHQTDRPVETARSERLTESGQVMGTFDYMAPEQAEDTHHADRQADVYALGCTLYRLLTGDPPYQGETAIQVLLAHREAAIPSLSEARPDVPARLDAVCQRMMAKRPEDRQPSMAAVVAELEACVAPQAPPVQGPVPPPAPQPPPPSPPPAAMRKSSATDSKLRAFLRSLAPASVATRRKATRATDETVGPQTEHETRMLDRRELTAAPRSRKTLLPVSIAGAAAAVVVILGLLLMLPEKRGQAPFSSRIDTARPTDRATKKGPVPFSEPELEPESQAPEWQPAWAETDAKVKALIAEQRFGEAEALYGALNERFEHVELNRKVADAIAWTQEQSETVLQEIEAQARQLSIEHKFADARAVLRPAVEKHAIRASAEAARKLLAEIDVAETEAKVETARRQAIERQQEIERRYADAMKP